MTYIASIQFIWSLHEQNIAMIVTNAYFNSTTIVHGLALVLGKAIIANFGKLTSFTFPI